MIEHEPTEVQTAHFWARWYNLLVCSGFSTEYTTDQMRVYEEHSKVWPEGERDYQLMAEQLVGRAIHHKSWYKDFGLVED